MGHKNQSSIRGARYRGRYRVGRRNLGQLAPSQSRHLPPVPARSGRPHHQRLPRALGLPRQHLSAELAGRHAPLRAPNPA